MTETTKEPRARRGVPIWALALIVIAAAGITYLITAMVMNIQDKKTEGATTFTQVVALTATTYDSSVWGQNYPKEYDGWKATEVFKPTAHKAALVAHTTSDKDNRTQTTPSKLEEDPRLVSMWAGNAFSLDYRHLRGHAWMLIDQRTTLRVLERAQPGACLNCHASTVEVMDQLGNGDAMAGFAAMNKMTYADATALAKAPIGCIDCHDPATMELRITRPALINGLAEAKAYEGITGYDVNRDATTQEMRTYVCAQCHVEYYFAGDAKTLVFPYKYGTDIDGVFKYYNEINFADFEHAKTGAKIIKAQHPEFETWNSSVHAANGVSCADCHMAYTRDGAQKVTNHDIASPLSNINGTCGTCHTASEQVIADRVTTIQNRFLESRDRTFDALTSLINALEKARADGTPEAQIALAQDYQREAGFYMDYVYSENSYGFHSPDYMQRLLSQSLDASRKGQLALLGVPVDQLAPSEVAQRHAEASAESGLR